MLAATVSMLVLGRRVVKMIDLVILQHLKARLDVPVYFEFPAEPPAFFVLLNLENNPRVDLIDSAILVASSYAPTAYETAVLNASVKSALDSLAEIPCISASRRGGDYPAFDLARKKYRYQAVQNITYYEE